MLSPLRELPLKGFGVDAQLITELMGLYERKSTGERPRFRQ